MISALRTFFRQFSRAEGGGKIAADAGNTLEALRARIDLLLAEGRRGEAAPLLFDAVDQHPDDAGLRRALAGVLQGAILGNAGDRERRVLAGLCADEEISAALLSTAICSSLASVPAAKWPDSALLCAALPRTVFADPGIEASLTQIRRGLLLGDIHAPPGFVCALARHCFLAEYAFAVEGNEALRARDAGERAAIALREAGLDASRLESLLLTACLYGPLGSLIRDTALPALAWSPGFRALVEEQVAHPRRESELAASLPTLTPIEGEVTSAVRAQYEENPYPRWACLQRPPVESFEALARRLRPGREPRPRRGRAQVLIAGCGTGQHPAYVACAHPDADVIAVDLSRASLAYAARMAEHFAIPNLRFAQADLLALGTLGRRFDIIESVGVLHHLADPMAGWRGLADLLEPGGLMRIALYSTRARACVAAAREVLHPLGLAPTPQGLRSARATLMALAPGHPARGVLGFSDFYSLSGCRDLLMHVQERTYTPLQVGECLDALGLELLAMECESPARESFARMFADPAARTDLAAWDRLDEAAPDSFRGMIQFWCARRMQASPPA